MTEVFRKLKELCTIPLFPVGGSVRDAVLRLIGEGECESGILSLLIPGSSAFDRLADAFGSEDLDAAGPLSPDEIANVLPSGWTARAVHPRLGTMLLSDGSCRIEYTPFRTETYPSDGTHAPIAVRYPVSMQEDAARRDFTVNALYLDFARSCLVDPLDGLRDLFAGRLRLADRDTLKHDGLRLLRLVRFEVTMGLTASQETARAAIAQAKLIRDVSPERIRAELSKTMRTFGVAVRATRLLKKYGLLRELGFERSAKPFSEKEPYLSFLVAAAGKKGKYLDAVKNRAALTKAETAVVLRAISLRARFDAVAVADALTSDTPVLLRGAAARRFDDVARRIEKNRSPISTESLAYGSMEFISDHPEIKEVGKALKKLRDEALRRGVPNEREALKRLWSDRCE